MRAALATLLMLLAVGLVGGAWGLDLSAWHATGLDPTVNAQGATVYAFMAWQGFFVSVAGLMGLFLLLRWMAGLVRADCPSTVDLIALFVAYTAGQGAFAGLLLRLFPGS